MACVHRSPKHILTNKSSFLWSFVKFSARVRPHSVLSEWRYLGESGIIDLDFHEKFKRIRSDVMGTVLQTMLSRQLHNAECRSHCREQTSREHFAKVARSLKHSTRLATKTHN